MNEGMNELTPQPAGQLIGENDKHCIMFLFVSQVILDVGCGTGILSLMCAKYGHPKQVQLFVYWSRY